MNMTEQLEHLLSRLPALLERMSGDPGKAAIVSRLEQVVPELRAIPTSVGENGDGQSYRRQLELLKELFAQLVQLRTSSAAVEAGLEELLATDLAKSCALAALAPEILERARQGIDEEELAAGIREIEVTGGLGLEDMIHEIQQAAGIDE